MTVWWRVRVDEAGSRVRTVVADVKAGHSHDDPVSHGRTGARLLALLVLCLCVTLAYQRWLFASAPQADEAPYVCASERIASGASPFAECPRYVYPPLLARAGALLVEHAGRAWLLGALRLVNGLGVVLCIGLSLELTRLSWRWRALIGSLLLLGLPPVRQTLELGNLSGGVAGLTTLALFGVSSAPLAAALLALALMLKPLPAAASLVLAAQGLALWQAKRSELPRPLLVGGAAALLAGGAFALSGGFGSPNPLYLDAQNNVSITRLLRSTGYHPPLLGVFVVVALAAAWLGARHAHDARFVKCLALVASLLAAPLVWNHSWLLIAPVVALAADRASGEPPPIPGWAGRLYWPLLVVLAATLLATSDALAACFFESKALNAPFVVLPLLTPILLLAFVRSRDLARLAPGG